MDATVADQQIAYIVSGAIREKDATGLEYKYSSCSLRSSKNSDWLITIEGSLDIAKGSKGKSAYEQLLNHRVKLSIKSSTIAINETKNDFKAGCYLKRQRYFLDGLVIGSEQEIQAWINFLRNDGRYIRKTKPYKLEVGSQYSIREQRSHSVAYR